MRDHKIGRYKSNIVKIEPPKICRYCGAKVSLVNNSELYGISRGQWPLIYLCARCKASVGVHPGTQIPLGNLANSKLRKARSAAHMAIDALWQSELIGRDKVYRQLARRLKIPEDKCHIGQMGLDDCKRVVDCAHEIAKELIKKETYYFVEGV